MHVYLPVKVPQQICEASYSAFTVYSIRMLCICRWLNAQKWSKLVTSSSSCLILRSGR